MKPLNVDINVQAIVGHVTKDACTRGVQTSVKDHYCVGICAPINVPKIVLLVRRNVSLPVFMDNVVTNAAHFASHALKSVSGSVNTMSAPKTVEKFVSDQDVVSHAVK